MRAPLEIAPLTAEELEALAELYRTTKDVRLRTRAQIVLAFWRAAAESFGHCPHCAGRDPNRPQLAQRLDGGRDRRAQGSTHARASSENYGGIQRAIAGNSSASAAPPGAALVDVDAS